MNTHIRTISLSLLLLGSLLSPVAFSVTARELDEKEAHLNEQWKRVEELGQTHARLAYLRDQAIGRDYKNLISNWYADADSWLKSLDSIVDSMQGERLASDRLAEYTTDQLKLRIDELAKLRPRIDEIYGAGDRISKDLNEMRILPENYLNVLRDSSDDDYSQQIRLLNGQIAEAKKQIVDVRSTFKAKSYDQLESYVTVMAGKLKGKVTTLALTHKDLENAVAKIEFALFTMRAIDSKIQTVLNQEGPMRDALYSKRIYEALAIKASLEKKVELLKAEIASNATLLPDVKQSGLKRLEMTTLGWAEEFKTALAANSVQDLFVVRYMDEVAPSSVAYRTCLNRQKAVRFDCNLLRTIVGFKPEQLRQLTPAQAEYMEKTITRMKQGPLRLGKAN